MRLQSIKDVDGYKRDEESSAILSVDNASLQAYKIKRKNQNAVLDDINSIKSELEELKTMLKLILSSEKGN